MGGSVTDSMQLLSGPLNYHVGTRRCVGRLPVLHKMPSYLRPGLMITDPPDKP